MVVYLRRAAACRDRLVQREVDDLNLRFYVSFFHFSLIPFIRSVADSGDGYFDRGTGGAGFAVGDYVEGVIFAFIFYLDSHIE